MKRKDVYFYYTTTGWMMWNWLVRQVHLYSFVKHNSGLSTGASIVLFDGSPFKPTPNILWELVERFRFFKNCENNSAESLFLVLLQNSFKAFKQVKLDLVKITI